MRDSHFDNLRTAYASIARLREALTEAREHIADATPEETRAKIDAALQAAPVGGSARATEADAPPERLAYRIDELAHSPRRSPPRFAESGRRPLAVLGDELDAGLWPVRRGGHKYRRTNVIAKSKASAIAIPSRITVCAFGRFEGGFRGGVTSHPLSRPRFPQLHARPLAFLLDEDHAGRFEGGVHLRASVWTAADFTVRRFQPWVGDPDFVDSPLATICGLINAGLHADAEAKLASARAMVAWGIWLKWEMLDRLITADIDEGHYVEDRIVVALGH